MTNDKFYLGKIFLLVLWKLASTAKYVNSGRTSANLLLHNDACATNEISTSHVSFILLNNFSKSDKKSTVKSARWKVIMYIGMIILIFLSAWNRHSNIGSYLDLLRFGSTNIAYVTCGLDAVKPRIMTLTFEFTDFLIFSTAKTRLNVRCSGTCSVHFCSVLEHQSVLHLYIFLIYKNTYKDNNHKIDYYLFVQSKFYLKIKVARALYNPLHTCTCLWRLTGDTIVTSRWVWRTFRK